MLKKLLLVYCQLMLVWGCSWGQQIFQKRYNVAGYNKAYFSNAIEFSDSTFVLSCTGVNNGQDATNIILEIDTVGNILWKKSFNFFATYGCKNYDHSLSYTGDINADSIGYLRLDSVGNVLTFLKIFISSDCFVSGIFATSDSGNILLATNDFGSFGNEKEFGTVIKLDKLGNIQWVKHFGGGLQTFLVDVKEITASFYEIYGSCTSLETDTVSSSNHNVFVLRLDGAGNQLSCNAIIETSNEVPWKYFIKNNGNRVFALSSNKLGIGTIITFIETDSSLNTVWSKCYYDGTMFLSGMDDFVNINDTMIAQTGFMFRLYDSTGNLLFAPNIYGIYGSYKRQLFYNNNSYHVFGSSSSAPFSYDYGIYFKINNQLNSGCYQNNNGPNIQVYNVPFVFQDTVIHDTTVAYTFSYDSLLATTDSIIVYTDCSGYTGLLEIVSTDDNIEIYPNPFNKEFTINPNTNEVEPQNVEMFDITGKKINCIVVMSGGDLKVQPPVNLNKGVYTLKLTTKYGSVLAHKILKL